MKHNWRPGSALPQVRRVWLCVPVRRESGEKAGLAGRQKAGLGTRWQFWRPGGGGGAFFQRIRRVGVVSTKNAAMDGVVEAGSVAVGG